MDHQRRQLGVATAIREQRLARRDELAQPARGVAARDQDPPELEPRVRRIGMARPVAARERPHRAPDRRERTVEVAFSSRVHRALERLCHHALLS